MPVEVMFVALGGMATFLMMIRMIHRNRLEALRLRSGGGEVNGRVEKLLADNAAEMAKMRERISVLEKLVTDDDRRLADEIERLRRSETRV